MNAKTVWVPMPKAASPSYEALHMEKALTNTSQINESINPVISDWGFIGY